MALKSPLMPSPTGGLMSAFSPYTDSPNSPAPFASTFPHSNRSSAPSDSLAPPPSPYPSHIDPSPVDSNGTESTEIEDDTQEDTLHEQEPEQEQNTKSPDDHVKSPKSQEGPPKTETALPTRSRSGSEDAPQSAIHAPSGFDQLDPKRSPPQHGRGTPSPMDTSDHTVKSPTTPDAVLMPEDKRVSMTSPINTDIPPAKFTDRGTPRAQTRQEAEEDWKQRSRRTPGLEDIPEAQDPDRLDDEQPSTAELIEEGTMVQAMEQLNNAQKDIIALKTALAECWTLCNTLAGLSSIHRERMFSFSGKGEVQELAWRSCWRLCQKLYDSRDEDHASQVRPTLELCRDFCQALFEARQRGDEAADSVLRVSFELNNHLYNTHDRNLPEAFRERTLDFYLTLCHRLMKQRTSLPEEADALLRACWSLAEMLFSLRQNTRDGKAADEELLGSAVQACWELCDLFREGWTQIRPDRGTPRPSQSTFPAQTFSQASRSDGRSSSMDDSYHDAPSLPPETPTTIFDDTAASSPDSVTVPNILVLGPEHGSTTMRGSSHNRWSSNASTLSGYSESASSTRTSSTATAGSEDANLVRLKCLIVKAAMNAGFNRNAATPKLPAFVKALPANSFGALPWQVALLESYKKLVLADPTLRAAANLPQRRVTAADVARAVKWMGRTGQYGWMRDLYRLVFGFLPEEVGVRKNVVIQT
ncbi:hypothetical protein BJ546DRAFT_360887 [Cryomyces antarcticus]